MGHAAGWAHGQTTVGRKLYRGLRSSSTLLNAVLSFACAGISSFKSSSPHLGVNIGIFDVSQHVSQQGGAGKARLPGALPKTAVSLTSKHGAPHKQPLDTLL